MMLFLPTQECDGPGDPMPQVNGHGTEDLVAGCLHPFSKDLLNFHYFWWVCAPEIPGCSTSRFPSSESSDTSVELNHIP